MVWFGLMSILGGACEPACGQSTHGRHQRRPGRSDPQPRQLLTPTTRHSPGQRHREPGGRLVCLYVRPPAGRTPSPLLPFPGGRWLRRRDRNSREGTLSQPLLAPTWILDPGPRTPDPLTSPLLSELRSRRLPARPAPPGAAQAAKPLPEHSMRRMPIAPMGSGWCAWAESSGVKGMRRDESKIAIIRDKSLWSVEMDISCPILEFGSVLS